MPRRDLGNPTARLSDTRFAGVVFTPLALLSAGCLEAGRRMATDRRIRTGSPRRRGLRFLALYALVLGVTAAGTALGWGALR